VTLRRGPYGLYVQLGEESEDDKGKKVKPRRASLTRDMNPDTLDLEAALGLLSLPRAIGRDPETGGEITAGIGRFGPYVRLGNVYQSLEPGDDVLSLGMNRAMELLAKARAKVRLVGQHPKDGAAVEIRKGRFGPYAMHGKTIANLPRGMEMEAATLEQAVQLLAEKGKELPPRNAKGGKGKAKPAARKTAEAAAPHGEGATKAAPAKGAAPQAASRKPATKKPAVKKPAVKKTAAKKAPAKKPPARRAPAKPASGAKAR
jgi:DNA topoisomerase-1